ncbi:MAG: inorganic phosphate transporter, partial [Bacteroidaceae bacterium]
AFAGNDLVNFIGVALAGLSSTQDFLAHGNGNPNTFMMNSLTLPAKTPVIYLIISGFVMALALFISKKARKVVGTTLSLAKQSEGDEIFSTSRISRRLVRLTLNATQTLLFFVPKRIRTWVNYRFEKSDDNEECPDAAFDLVRASVNLVLSGLLIVVGTSLQLPLSTTYVAFMVSMGSSLADRAWGRESAVYRITGVISVIGGWFITAGGAFMLCFLITSLMFFGGPVAMAVVVAVVLFVLIRSSIKFKEKTGEDECDVIYNEMIHCQDKEQTLHLLSEHIAITHSHVLDFARTCFFDITDGLMRENVKLLRKTSNSIREEKSFWLKSRQKEIVGMRMIDYYDAVKKNTWFHLGGNSITQIIYCLKRMSDPCLEHVDNNFNPLPKMFIKEYTPIRDEVVEMFEKASEIIQNHEYEQIDTLLVEGNDMKSRLSSLRHRRENTLNKEDNNIRLDLLYLNTLQETQELAATLRHLLRATKRFNSQEDENITNEN